MPLSRFLGLMGALEDPAVAEWTCGLSLLDPTSVWFRQKSAGLRKDAAG